MAKKQPATTTEEVLRSALFNAGQRQENWLFGGESYRRIAYGEEIDDWDSDNFPCADCGVTKGQFHLANCDAEKCPKCQEQALGCLCERDDRRMP